MNTYEKKLNVKYIAGIDEVGRGPLAGPVVAAAVILPSNYKNINIKDSKKLSNQKREKMAKIIKKIALTYSIVFVDVQTIDQINIKNATKLAMQKAVKKLKIEPQYLLIDYEKIDINIPQQGIIKGDEKSISIASASILAKVARDQYMKKLAIKYPNYDFDNNMGYGTLKHREAIKKYGWTIHHRKTFNPIKTLIAKNTYKFIK